MFLMVFSFAACRPSSEYLKLKEQGCYPDTTDFPNTKWTSNEFDIYFCVFDYGEDYIIGEYLKDSKSYRVIAQFEFDTLNFSFISTINKTESTYSDKNDKSFTNCEVVEYGYLNTKYTSSEKMISCTIEDSNLDEFENGKTITFKRTNNLPLEIQNRWESENGQIYLESYYGMKNYYKGQIMVDQKIIPIQGFEVGNSNYYLFTFKNGIINNLNENSTSPFVCILLTSENEQLVGKITDDSFCKPNFINIFEYDLSDILFNKKDVVNS